MSVSSLCSLSLSHTLPFSRRRQRSFSRSLVKPQNTRPGNCDDRTLVRLITLHYKCIKLESSYKRARERERKREPTKPREMTPGKCEAASNFRAMKGDLGRWEPSRKSNRQSDVEVALHVYERRKMPKFRDETRDATRRVRHRAN